MCSFELQVYEIWFLTKTAASSCNIAKHIDMLSQGHSSLFLGVKKLIKWVSESLESFCCDRIFVIIKSETKYYVEMLWQQINWIALSISRGLFCSFSSGRRLYIGAVQMCVVWFVYSRRLAVWPTVRLCRLQRRVWSVASSTSLDDVQLVRERHDEDEI